MRVLDRIVQFLKGESSPFDSFELSVIEHLEGALNEDDRKIFQDQIAHFNIVQRMSGKDGKEEIFMYWKEWGKIRRDFPLRFNIKEKEWKFATITIDSSVGLFIVEFWLVDGALCSMELSSSGDESRPLHPDYSVRSLVIHT